MPHKNPDSYKDIEGGDSSYQAREKQLKAKHKYDALSRWGKSGWGGGKRRPWPKKVVKAGGTKWELDTAPKPIVRKA